jgi:DNA-binding protein YbaB
MYPDRRGERSLEQVGRELRQVRSDLAQEEVEGQAGEGAVRVVVSGLQEVRRVVISPEWLRPEAAAQLETWIREAMNQAILNSQTLAARAGPTSRIPPGGG